MPAFGRTSRHAPPVAALKIVQARGVTVILLEEFVNLRQILTDGRSLSPPVQPAWYGYSIGQWNGDLFVVTTAGFNDQTWLDGSGLPHSEELRLTERFRRFDYGTWRSTTHSRIRRRSRVRGRRL